MSAGSQAWGIDLAIASTATLIRRCLHLFPPDWRLLRSTEPPDERVICRQGLVEIREVSAGFAAETCVKGEPHMARKTALRRLANYLGGDNRGGLCLRTRRPVTQRFDASGRWRVRVLLPDMTGARAALIARGGKVRLGQVASETLAVIRAPGCPTGQRLARGEAAILDAIAGTAWTVTGPAMIRLHSPPRSRALGGWFEVALPVRPVGTDGSGHSTQ